MCTGIALLALTAFAGVSDPEQVMPLVLRDFLPTGLRGLVIAGLLAPMYLVAHAYRPATLCLVALLLTVATLRVTWHRHLPPAAPKALDRQDSSN